MLPRLRRQTRPGPVFGKAIRQDLGPRPGVSSGLGAQGSPAAMPSPSLFEDPAALAALYAPPAQPEREPPSNFPLPWYQLFLQEIRRLGIQVITYRDLFEGC